MTTVAVTCCKHLIVADRAPIEMLPTKALSSACLVFVNWLENGALHKEETQIERKLRLTETLTSLLLEERTTE